MKSVQNARASGIWLVSTLIDVEAAFSSAKGNEKRSIVDFRLALRMETDAGSRAKLCQ